MDLGVPNGRKWGLERDFVWNPLRCKFLTLKIFCFVSNTSTPHSTSTWKWVPRANFDQKCPKTPKNRLFWKSLRNSQSDLWSWNLAKTALWGLKNLKNRIFVIFGFFDPPGPTLEKFVAENFGKNQKWQFFKIVSGGRKKQKMTKILFFRFFKPQRKDSMNVSMSESSWRPYSANWKISIFQKSHFWLNLAWI